MQHEMRIEKAVLLAEISEKAETPGSLTINLSRQRDKMVFLLQKTGKRGILCAKL